MPSSQFGTRDWLLGWLVPAGNTTAAIQAVTLVDTSGNSLAAGAAGTPIIGSSGNVANAVGTATLTPTATTTAYLSGFEITGSGSTVGLPVTVTITGLLGGTRQYTYVFSVGALVANQPLIVEFQQPLPASAVNTPIVVSCPAGGTGNTNNTVVAHGFYL